MNENNALTKEELKEILAEMAKELRAETAAQFEAADKRTAARFEELESKNAARFEGINQNVAALSRKVDANDQKLEAFRAEFMARFDSADIKHSNVVTEIFKLRRDMDAREQKNQETQSQLLTGMDKVMKELENHRVERISLGVIQNRHTKDIESLKRHVALERSNDDHDASRKGKKPGPSRKKKSK